MTVKADVHQLADAIRQCDHNDPKVTEMHELAWKLVCRHSRLLGLSNSELLTIGNPGMQAQGGGTDKTPPPQ